MTRETWCNCEKTTQRNYFAAAVQLHIRYDREEWAIAQKLRRATFSLLRRNYASAMTRETLCNCEKTVQRNYFAAAAFLFFSFKRNYLQHLGL